MIFMKFRDFLVLGRKSIDLSFVLLLLRAKCENCDFQCRNRLARNLFRVFHKTFKDFHFSWKFYVIFTKNHLQIYALGNDFLCNHQTTGDFLAKNADFSVLGLKITKFGDFHEKIGFCGPNHHFPPPVSNHQ